LPYQDTIRRVSRPANIGYGRACARQLEQVAGVGTDERHLAAQAAIHLEKLMGNPSDESDCPAEQEYTED
jgi:hypothetical protein